MFGFDSRSKITRRRWAIRERCPDSRSWWRELRGRGALVSLAIAAIFWMVLTALFLLRKDIVAYRPGQFVPHDIVARVDFDFRDDEALHQLEEKAAGEASPRVYRRAAVDPWTTIQNDLLALPERVHERRPEELEPPLSEILDSGAIAELEQYRTGPERTQYEREVKSYLSRAQNLLTDEGRPLVILKKADRDEELRLAKDTAHPGVIILEPAVPAPANLHPAFGASLIDIGRTFGDRLPEQPIKARLGAWAKDEFGLGLANKIARITVAELEANPNYQLDEPATAEEKNRAESQVNATLTYQKDEKIIAGGNTLSDRDWQLLNAENQAYHRSLSANVFKLWQYRLGLAMLALIITIILGAYVARYQPRCVRNHARALALAALLLSMLLLTQLAGIGSNTLYLLGIAPTILTALILTIAYDQRFAVGMASIQAVIVTAALNQNLGFFLILWVGVLTACYTLGDIRTRSKLIEVGGAAALAMIAVTAAVGAVEMEPIQFIARNCQYVGAAGLIAGFFVLGVLPFIEKAFRITTSMTLLELADASQPLLRRLALEAPGTYNHSLQVATLAEAAAEAIHANSLLCRVGSYYHDIGKINKPDYFVENQMGGENRHLNLSPSLSLRIILSHVKDGVEMAKEYNLPTSLLPIIQQHHGTTLVEYFYHQAVTQGDQQPDTGPRLSDTEFRYPGPKPKSKESAIVMLCDAVESACRCLAEPTASRLESKVHELTKKRLEDGQFDECDLTLRDLEHIERSLIKTLLGIYHGRITYPTEAVAPPKPAAKTA